MSNIHADSARHGVDDEFNHGQPERCLLCWSRAKTAFFGPDRPARRGVTLRRVYTDIFTAAHNGGNRH